MTCFVYSTLAAGVKYTFYEERGGRPEVVKEIHIKGGAGVVPKRGEILTKMGVRTEISDEDYELLKGHHTFQTHLKNECVVVQKSTPLNSGKENPEKVARDMGKDKSAPKVPADYPASKDPMKPTPVPVR